MKPTNWIHPVLCSCGEKMGKKLKNMWTYDSKEILCPLSWKKRKMKVEKQTQEDQWREDVGEIELCLRGGVGASEEDIVQMVRKRTMSMNPGILSSSPDYKLILNLLSAPWTLAQEFDFQLPIISFFGCRVLSLPYICIHRIHSN